MNVYDFDKTIYEGDSTRDFYRYCIRKNKKVLLALPRTAVCGAAYLAGRCDKTAFKEVFFEFLGYLEDPHAMVESFWKIHAPKIKAFYLRQKRPDDVIISASPEFLLQPVCRGVTLIGSRVDAKTGVFTGKNCYGPEKVLRLMERFPGAAVEEFYSDSLSDAPLAALAEKACFVQGEKLIPWPESPAGQK